MTSRWIAGAAMIIPLAVIGCGGSAPEQAAVPAGSPPPAASSAGAQELPPGHPPTRLQPAHRSTLAEHGTAGAPASRPEWDVPSGWTSEEPSSRMRQAQYRLPAVAGDPEDGQCAVFYFGPGQGGGVEANIARWARQFADPSGRPATPEVTQIASGGQSITRVEVKGAHTPSPMSMMGGGAPTRREGYQLLGAIMPIAPQTDHRLQPGLPAPV